MRQGLTRDQFIRALVNDGLSHPEGWQGDVDWREEISRERASILRRFPELAKPSSTANTTEHDREVIEPKHTKPA